MHIEIDGKVITISEEMLEELTKQSIDEFMKFYDKIEQTPKLGIKTMIRTWVFPFLEKTMGVLIRPPKNIDPTNYLVHQILLFVEDVLKHAQCIITTENDGKTHSPTAFRISITGQGEGGRQLAFNWAKRIGKDDIRETTSRNAS